MCRETMAQYVRGNLQARPDGRHIFVERAPNPTVRKPLSVLIEQKGRRMAGDGMCGQLRTATAQVIEKGGGGRTAEERDPVLAALAFPDANLARLQIEVAAVQLD